MSFGIGMILQKEQKKHLSSEERELYELIRDTKMEARFSLMDLYGFLHLPFSTKEPKLIAPMA